jgi:hypothetical protein
VKHYLQNDIQIAGAPYIDTEQNGQYKNNKQEEIKSQQNSTYFTTNLIIIIKRKNKSAL